jgi:hypothetical protein
VFTLFKTLSYNLTLISPLYADGIQISLQTYDWEMIRITSRSNKTDFRPNPWILEKERLEEQFFRQHISAIKATGLLDPSIEKNQ